MSAKQWRNAQASLLKFCKDSIIGSGVNVQSFKPFNFDTHATINQLPNEDLVGIAELSLRNDQETYEITVMFVVCTGSDDTYSERLNPMIDYLFDKLKPGHQIMLVTEDTGQIVGKATIERGVTVLPIASTKGRPMQAISVVLASSLISPP